MVEMMAINPRKVLRLDQVKIEAGNIADLTVIDPEATWTVTKEDFYSKAVNSAFLGAELKGRASDVYIGGYATMEEGVIVE
jgi:dihydroorotase